MTSYCHSYATFSHLLFHAHCMLPCAVQTRINHNEVKFIFELCFTIDTFLQKLQSICSQTWKVLKDRCKYDFRKYFYIMCALKGRHRAMPCPAPLGLAFCSYHRRCCRRHYGRADGTGAKGRRGNRPLQIFLQIEKKCLYSCIKNQIVIPFLVFFWLGFLSRNYWSQLDHDLMARI